MSGRAGPAGLAVRDAVRRGLSDLAPRDLAPAKLLPLDLSRPDAGLVLVACSGGPDSLALAAATAFVAPRLGLRAGAVIVDHGLQPLSAQVAATTAESCRALGLDPVDVEPVQVDGEGDGPEAAARQARYAALDRAAARHDAAAVLLGHTRDDQAEAVLLGLLRGSGARSLSGMAPVRGIYRRPLLGLPRRTTLESCAELGLEPWSDPHNDDPAYTRSRVRSLLAELEERVGSGTTAGLARTAELLRADDAALQDWAARAYASAQASATAPNGERPAAAVTLDCAVLADLPGAVRNRVIQAAALAAGARSADLTSTQLAAVAALVTDWHGQGPVALPGPATAARDCGRLVFASPPGTSTATQTER
jgi:tRNA(Ile)-lysidine synthase